MTNPDASTETVSSQHEPATQFLSLQHQRFCEAILLGKSRAEAYLSAFPEVTELSARSLGCRLFRKPHIQAELTRMRTGAEAIAGSAIIDHVEIRVALSRIVRAHSGRPDKDTDLGKASRRDGTDTGIRTRDKLQAINLLLK